MFINDNKISMIYTSVHIIVGLHQKVQVFKMDDIKKSITIYKLYEFAFCQVIHNLTKYIMFIWYELLIAI